MGLSAFGRPDFRSFPVVFKRREKDEKIFVLENFLLFDWKKFSEKVHFSSCPIKVDHEVRQGEQTLLAHDREKTKCSR